MIDREALIDMFNEHWIDLTGRCACGQRLPGPDPRNVREHLADAVIEHLESQQIGR